MSPRKVSARIDRDGYIVLRGRRPRFEFPWHAVALLAAVFFATKGVVVAARGPHFYKELPIITNDGVGRDVALWALQPDPISGSVASIFNGDFGVVGVARGI